MEELLASTAGIDDEDLLIQITHATWSDISLQMQIVVSVNGTKEDTWILSCKNVLAQSLIREGMFSLQLVDDHPILWEFRQVNASAFFRGIPSNRDACVGALYAAHRRTVGFWINFGSQLNNSSRISELLETGDGLLAIGPIALLNAYREALAPYGVDVSIVGEHRAHYWDGNVRKRLTDENVMALLLGSSYLVGIGFTAEKQAT